MVVKVKEKFEKSRHGKNNNKPKKFFYEEKEMQDIMIEINLKKINLIIK